MSTSLETTWFRYDLQEYVSRNKRKQVVKRPRSESPMGEVRTTKNFRITLVFDFEYETTETQSKWAKTEGTHDASNMNEVPGT